MSNSENCYCDLRKPHTQSRLPDLQEKDWTVCCSGMYHFYSHEPHCNPHIVLVQAKQRNKLEAELHMRYGHHLFAEGDFEESLAQLGMSSGSNAISLLHLFPSLASPAFLQPMLHLTPGAPGQLQCLVQLSANSDLDMLHWA